MKIENFIRDSKFTSILNNYSDNEQIVEILSSLVEKIKNKEIIIPVLGMQGMGKSTLINALLKENILPNDADETTCVPVEIKYGESEEAIVYFKNSDKIKKVYTRDDLNEYVDNMHNPGNEKEISHIVLYRKVDLLKNGVTIVDLPGVGSLTKENQDTTMRYIKNLCTAIFVIPTTPTIRRSEEIFIKSVWMQFNSAIFVQNNFGESKREVRESVEFNRLILQNIAKSINTSYHGDIKVVNAYDAICGAINNDEEQIIESNINLLSEELENTVSNWSDNEEKNIIARMGLIIDSCKNKINNLIIESKMSQEELKHKLEDEEELFKNNNKKLSKEIEKIEDYLCEKEDIVADFARNEAKTCAESIRSDVYRIIDSGVVDGDQLTEAFSNYQENHLNDVVNNFFDLSQDITYELSEMIEALEDIVRVENEISIETLNFNNGDAFKYEKGLKIGIDLLGALGGFVGLPMIITGIPGFIGGIVIMFVANIIGKKAKNSVTNKRASKAKSEISIKIDEIEDIIKREIITGFNDISENIKSALEEYMVQRKKELKEIKSKNIDLLCKGNNEKYNMQQLENDYVYLTNRGKEIYA